MNQSLFGKASLILFACLSASTMVAQQKVGATAPVATSSAVPGFVTFNGVIPSVQGRAPNGVTGVTFLLYQDAQGGAPLWMETQNGAPGNQARGFVRGTVYERSSPLAGGSGCRAS